MRHIVGTLLTAAAIAACSGSDAAPPPLETAPPITPAPTTDTPNTTHPTEPTPAPTQPQPTHPPTTTIDDATILAEAEAASLTAFEASLDSIRDPDGPENETLLRDHYALNNLDLVLNNLELTRSGNFIAEANETNPSFALTYGDATFVGPNHDEVALTVCEFYSDRLFERGTAPDGTNVLVRDEPLTQILRVEMILEDERWKSARGEVFETVNDEVERCTTAS